jgi:hypothetical protein
MPLYYFDIHDREQFSDLEGTQLDDDAAALEHARRVVRELIHRRSGMLDQDWSGWTMRVRNAEGVELFALPFTDVERADG